MKLHELFSEGIGRLKKAGFEDPTLDTEILLREAAGFSREEFFLKLREYDLPSNSKEKFEKFIERREKGEPVAYIIGRKEFMGLRFIVSPDVLIPRPETELLVETSLQWLKDRNIDSPRILDLGTGSGCIAIALARFLDKSGLASSGNTPGSIPDAGKSRVVAVDISDKALEIAKKNASLHGVSIDFLEGDFFAPLPAADEGEISRFHLIVSNPPYVLPEEFDRLPRGVRNFEPHLALKGDEGIYRRIIDQAPDFLLPGGMLCLEISPPRKESVEGRMKERGFVRIETLADLGGNPRVVKGEIEPGL